MASKSRALPTNADGDFFVDDTCIDCATCRWVAPDTFDYADGASRVYAQPSNRDHAHRALMAALACPTASIGFDKSVEGRPSAAKAARDAWPEPIGPEPTGGGEDGAGAAGAVYHCGYHSEASYGAASYLVVRPDGNVLVDSPRFNQPLLQQIEALGGVHTMFLTHRDDVADHERWALATGCRRVMHKDDVSHGTRAVEQQIGGRDPVPLEDDLLVIPTPGHTRGSACLLFAERVLFTGDHLAFSRSLGHLYAFRDACWYSWPEVVRSTERLFAAHRFLSVLPGHGRRYVAPSDDDMARQQATCLSWMHGV